MLTGTGYPYRVLAVLSRVLPRVAKGSTAALGDLAQPGWGTFRTSRLLTGKRRRSRRFCDANKSGTLIAYISGDDAYRSLMRGTSRRGLGHSLSWREKSNIAFGKELRGKH